MAAIEIFSVCSVGWIHLSSLLVFPWETYDVGRGGDGREARLGKELLICDCYFVLCSCHNRVLDHEHHVYDP